MNFDYLLETDFNQPYFQVLLLPYTGHDESSILIRVPSPGERKRGKGGTAVWTAVGPGPRDGPGFCQLTERLIDPFIQ